MRVRLRLRLRRRRRVRGGSVAAFFSRVLMSEILPLYLLPIE